MPREDRVAFHYGDFFDYSPPIKTRGGIKARSRRGGFGETWWAGRWMEVLEGFRLGSRLARARTYARQGQVLSIDVKDGAVSAAVQGSRPKPYSVEIAVKKLGKRDWARLSRAFLDRPVFAAKLLSGQMPENIEEAFSDVGLSLFPEKFTELETDCSCPDWSNPCKHIAAVYILLGEEFDRDPFLIFALRGADRENLLGFADSRGRVAPRPDGGHTPSGRSEPPPEPLPLDPAEFWGQENADREEYAPGSGRIPTVPAALPRRLGSFPFWRSSEGFLPTLERIYARASQAGQSVFIGEWQDTDHGEAGSS